MKTKDFSTSNGLASKTGIQKEVLMCSLLEQVQPKRSIQSIS